jgi:single-strand DNA-binding protein
MSGAFEQTIIIGNVGRDPELRYTQSGVPVCSFSVAVSSSWTDKATNEKREKTNWYRVTAWRRLGEICNQYVKKGMSVMVQGTCEASAFMGQDGQPRSSLDLTAREVQFLTRADGAGGSGSGSGGQYDDNYSPPPQDLDDIPF